MRARVILSYCVAVYALGWSLQFAAIRTSTGHLDNIAATPWLAAGIMFMPALVALAFLWFVPSTRNALKWRPTWRMLPLFVASVVIPTLLAFAVVAFCAILGWGKAGWFSFTPDHVTITGGPWLLGKGSQGWPRFLTNVAVTGLGYAAFNGVFAAGEELGWRGFVQGMLVEKLGTTRGIVLLGLIWSFWHLPLLLAGYNYPDHPFLGAFVLFPAMLIAASFFLGWLTIKAGTFWPAALAHGATNSIEEGVINNVHLSVAHLYEDGLRLALTVVVGLAFWALLQRDKQHQRP